MSFAYSYLRFSSPAQATGDSIRRQVERTAAWCGRHAVTLDQSITLRDQGVSAFRGKHRENPDLHALAGFLNAVKAGRVPAGSYLVLESLDRLTREKIRPALTLLLNLIEAGVKVVQLSPLEVVYDEDVEPMSLMMAIMELNRGHSESAMKSDRVGRAWAQKQQGAGQKVVTKRLPGWIKYVGGDLVLDPSGVDAVRRMFALAIGGHGAGSIAQTLTAEKVPVIGRAVFKGRPVVWGRTTVALILASRATVGEYVPYKTRAGKRPGAPVPGYFPVVIDEDTYFAAQAAVKTRGTVGAGRRGKHVNLFAGLLVDARGGGSMTYDHHKGQPSAIIPVDAAHSRGGKWVSFPAAHFERAVLSQLAEVKASDIAGDNDAARRVEALSGRIQEIDGLVKLWTAKMDDPSIVDAVAAKLAELNGKRRQLAGDLGAAQREAASPISEALGGLHTLADMIEADGSDELRLKVRAALRRCIESVHCLFAGGRRARRAAVRVQFRGTDAHRDYLFTVTYAGHGKGRHGVLAVKTFAEAGAGIDLRKPADAAEVERALAAADVAKEAEAVAVKEKAPTAAKRKKK